MRSVRQAGTSPELTVRTALEALGIRFTVNVEGLPGRPDILLTGSNTPIFVHGCFWHRHHGCKKTTTPKRNRSFWVEKFEKNIERDNRNIHRLKALGFMPVTVWQCETEATPTLKEILVSRLQEETV